MERDRDHTYPKAYMLPGGRNSPSEENGTAGQQNTGTSFEPFSIQFSGYQNIHSLTTQHGLNITNNIRCESVPESRADEHRFLSSQPQGLAPDIPVNVYQRVSYLETLVAELNEKLKDYESVKRTNGNLLDTLTRTKTKLDVVTKARDDVYENCEHQKTEIYRLIKENEKLKQQLKDKNVTIAQGTTENNELRTKIKTLQQQVQLRGELDNGRSLSLPLPLEQIQIDSVSPSGVEVRNNLSNNTNNNNSSNNGPNTPAAKRKKFSCELSPLPQCKNCQTVFFDPEGTPSGPCKFHRAHPQPYVVWSKQIEARDARPNMRYWPCCNIYSKTTPAGCMGLKHHDVFYPHEDN